MTKKTERICEDCYIAPGTVWRTKGSTLCNKCNGTGYGYFFPVGTLGKCPHCSGTGQCQTCGGTGLEHVETKKLADAYEPDEATQDETEEDIESYTGSDEIKTETSYTYTDSTDDNPGTFGRIKFYYVLSCAVTVALCYGIMLLADRYANGFLKAAVMVLGGMYIVFGTCMCLYLLIKMIVQLIRGW